MKRTLYFVPCRIKDDSCTRIWSAIANSYSEAVQIVINEHSEDIEFMPVKDNKFTNEWASIEELKEKK